MRSPAPISIFTFAALLAASGCGATQHVEVVDAGPVQTLPDGLEAMPTLSTVADAPEQGRTALSVRLQIENRGSEPIAPVPTVTVEFLEDDGVTVPSVVRSFDLSGRAARRHIIDSIGPGQGTGMGLTTSPEWILGDTRDEGLYRVRAVITHPEWGERVVDIGRVRLHRH
jgi:hypothetical protein